MPTLSLAFRKRAWSDDAKHIRRAFRQHGPQGARALEIIQRLVRGAPGEFKVELESTKERRTGLVRMDRHATVIEFREHLGSFDNLCRKHASQEGWGADRSFKDWLRSQVELDGGEAVVSTTETIPAHTYTSFQSWVECIDEAEGLHAEACNELLDEMAHFYDDDELEPDDTDDRHNARLW